MIRPRQVNEARALATWMLRLVGLLLMLYGLVRFTTSLAYLLGDGFLFESMSQWDDTGSPAGVFVGPAVLAIGFGFSFWARSFARWVISVPETSCLRCGYEGIGARDLPRVRAGWFREHEGEQGGCSS